MEIGLVQKINIDNEMQQAYLDYAMSVIVARALPDARDGLKPVHRRILYAMYDMGLRPDSTYKKSARIVGEVLGKYHPHGDMAVYEAMARMAQDFSMRYLLVDGQGNFGSVDGDPPAAMRYTEARIADAAVDMLSDIQKDTVNYLDNFDGTLTEPVVLPSAIPNLLVNGATGIAVGMSTSIPPHNLGEVVDALIYILNRWEKMDDITLDELMQFVQGPDFPTGGIIIQSADGDGLHSAYGTGRGKVTIQARAHIEEMERGRSRIIVTELPYMTNKSALIERIASLVRDERLDGIADLRDESDRQGMRIVIELNKAADPEKVLFGLYKSTPMQSTFSIIVLALVDGEPRMLGLKQALRVYVEHRIEIIRRRSEYDLARARQRAHILEGLLIALRNLDEVINLIRHSKDADTAKLGLIKKFKLSEVQALAILDMPLRRLASLERKKLEDEYKELLAQIKELEGLLKSPKKMRQVVSDELLAVKERHGDRRRTQIVILKEGESTRAVLTATDLAPEKAVWVSVTAEGLISRTMDNKPPRTSGRDAPILLANCNTRHTLYLVTNQGEAAAIAMQAIPETEKPSEGIPIFRISALKEKDTLTAILSLPAKSERNEESYLLTVSRLGMVKKSSLVELPGPSAHSFTLVKVNEDDTLGWARVTNGKNDLLLLTRQGMAIRFSEEDVRPMGLVAAGVLGIKLASGDVLCGMEILPQPGEILIAASDGSAKRIAPDQFPRQGRYGQGVSAWKLPARVYAVGMVLGKGNERVTLHLAKQASKSIRLDDAPLVGRAARGKTVIELKADDEVLYLTRSQEDSGGPAPKPPRKPPSSDGSIPNRRSSAQKPTSQKAARPMKEAAPKRAAKKTSSASAKTPPKPASKTRPAATAPSAARSTTVKKAPTKGTTEKQKTGKQSTATQLPLLSVPEAKKSSKPVRGEKQAPVKKTPAKSVSPKATASKQTSTKPTSTKATTAKQTTAKKAPAEQTPVKQTPAKQPPAKPATARHALTKPAPAKPAPSKPSGKSPTKRTPPPK